jgi:hypothetical protein
MLLGFVVSERGIEANPEKTSTMMDMGPIKKLKAYSRSRATSRLCYFIARLRLSESIAYCCTNS